MFGGWRETFYLTRPDSLKFVAEWKRRNIHGAFDYNHELKESAGWFELEARDDGLWAVNIKWTPTLLKHFAAKEYRYYSPYFQTQDRNGKSFVTALLNVAITNFPATDNQRPLIALSQRRSKKYMYDAQSAKALASKIISLLKADEAQADSVALLLMEGAAPAEEAPAEELAIEATPEQQEAQVIAQTAYSVTGLKGAAVVGALKALSAAAAERDAARKELATIKHSQAVEDAIRAKKLAPAKRAEALASDPQEFLGAMRFASLIVDDTVLTPAPKAEPKAADVINDAMRSYCAKHSVNVDDFAANWIAKWGNVPFEAR
jgi:phage I-like protein